VLRVLRVRVPQVRCCCSAQVRCQHSFIWPPRAVGAGCAGWGGSVRIFLQ
jgi:hypothetical protein